MTGILKDPARGLVLNKGFSRQRLDPKLCLSPKPDSAGFPGLSHAALV
jgi:hypothetical protein